jgi:hypothetical protein
MEAQARMQELGGGSLPSASESWGSSDDLSTRQPAGGTHRDFVSNEAGWTLEELFDPLAIDPALVATKAVPSTSDLC